MSGETQSNPDDQRGSSEVGPAAAILNAVQRAFASRGAPRTAAAGSTTPPPASARPGGHHNPGRSGPGGEPPRNASDRTADLRSPDPSIRREALERISADGIDPGDATTARAVARVLLGDPESSLRATAARLLIEVGWGSPDDVDRALRDPDDEVRAAAVRMAAARGPSALDRLIPLVSDRRWPLTQQATLSVLPAMLAAAAGNGADVMPLLREIGAL